jgi:adenine-specific DNA-methyltransferase
VWAQEEAGTTDEGSRAIESLFGVKVFTNPKPTKLVEKIGTLMPNNTSPTNAVFLDFFAGSGTTAHAVMNLNRQDGGRRRYILVEMADYFYSVLLPRVKKVAFSDKWREGKAHSDGTGISHFVKYYELEQFEDTLRRVRYADSEPIAPDDALRYLFLRDLKLADALEIEGETVRVALEKLYPNIDLAETLSNLLGKPIRRIEPDPNDPTRPAKVVFTDGDEVDLQNPDWKRIKPLIWW